MIEHKSYAYRMVKPISVRSVENSPRCFVDMRFRGSSLRVSSTTDFTTVASSSCSPSKPVLAVIKVCARVLACLQSGDSLAADWPLE